PATSSSNPASPSPTSSTRSNGAWESPPAPPLRPNCTWLKPLAFFVRFHLGRKVYFLHVGDSRYLRERGFSADGPRRTARKVRGRIRTSAHRYWTRRRPACSPRRALRIRGTRRSGTTQ